MTGRRRLLVITNPTAGRCTPRTRERVLAELRRHGQLDVVATSQPRHAIDLAAAAAGSVDAIIVVAGDGTMNEVLNGAAVGIPLGVCPCGGTNVLARALGLPRDPVAAAGQIGGALAAERTRRVRLATMNGRRFAFSGGIGLDAEVVRRVDAQRRRRGRRPGDAHFAVQLALTVAGRRYSRPRATLTTPTETLRVASVIAANMHPWTFVGPVSLKTGLRAQPEAGFDLIAPQRILHRDLPRIALEMLLTGAHSRGVNRWVAYHHDQTEARVTCDEPLPAEVDGEDIGDVAEARLGIETEPARILV